MINLIIGKIIEINTTNLCILTNNNIGYEIDTTTTTLAKLQINNEVTLWTYLIVREDAHILCGFLSKNERDTFKTLIKVSGIGLRMALAMLTVMTPNELAAAVVSGDDTRLTAIPGVGKKTAQRLIIELKDKLHNVAMAPASNINNNTSEQFILLEAERALISLGYKEKEAQNAIKLAKEAGAVELEPLIRLGLKNLAGL